MRTTTGLAVVTALVLGVPLLTAPVTAAPSTKTTVDDRALVRKGIWRNKSFTGAHAGTLSKSKDKGATLTSVDATTGGGKVLLQFGPGRGKLVIKVGGVRQKVVLTAADTKQIKKVPFSGDGVVTLKVKKPRRGVYIDALELKLTSPPTPPPPPAPTTGQLVLTEIMQNPSTLEDNDAEWFEFTNVAGHAVDLGGCLAGQETEVTSPLPDIVVPPGDHVVMVRSADPAANGGITADGTFTFALVNTNGVLRLTCGAVIDVAAWTTSTASTARSLSASSTNAVANDDDANWCAATATYSFPNLGTPGAVNPVCS